MAIRNGICPILRTVGVSFCVAQSLVMVASLWADDEASLLKQANGRPFEVVLQTDNPAEKPGDPKPGVATPGERTPAFGPLRKEGRPVPGGAIVNPYAPRKVKAAYLGVSASPLTPVLRSQFGLPEGVGLVVDLVSDGSPAAGAGIARHDILHKLNDQILINVQQLLVLVRTYKAGDEITLHVIRQAKPLAVTVKLAEHETLPLDAMSWGSPDLPVPGQMPGGWGRTPNDFVYDREKGTLILRGPDGKILFEQRVPGPMVMPGAPQPGVRNPAGKPTLPSVTPPTPKTNPAPPPGSPAAPAVNPDPKSTSISTASVANGSGAGIGSATSTGDAPVTQLTLASTLPVRQQVVAILTVGDQTLHVTTNDQGRRVLLVYRQGELLAEHPIETPEELNALPATLRAKVDRVLKLIGS